MYNSWSKIALLIHLYVPNKLLIKFINNCFAKLVKLFSTALLPGRKERAKFLIFKKFFAKCLNGERERIGIAKATFSRAREPVGARGGTGARAALPRRALHLILRCSRQLPGFLGNCTPSIAYHRSTSSWGDR